MTTQVHTTISQRTLAVCATVGAGLCLAAPTTSAAMPGPAAEYAVAPAVMRTGTYLRVHPNRQHVLAGRKLHGTIYLPRHVMLAP
jgi:hypothetical protein